GSAALLGEEAAGTDEAAGLGSAGLGGGPAEGQVAVPEDVGQREGEDEPARWSADRTPAERDVEGEREGRVPGLQHHREAGARGGWGIEREREAFVAALDAQRERSA